MVAPTHERCGLTAPPQCGPQYAMLENRSKGSEIILKAIAFADSQYPLMMLLMISIGMGLNSALAGMS